MHNNREDEHNATKLLEVSMVDVKTWVDSVHLKLNSSKTEFIYFGSRHHLTKMHHRSPECKQRIDAKNWTDQIPRCMA